MSSRKFIYRNPDGWDDPTEFEFWSGITPWAVTVDVENRYITAGYIELQWEMHLMLRCGGPLPQWVSQ